MANLKMREQFVFQSQDERKNFKDALEKNFRRKVDIELTLRSYNVLAAHLDTLGVFEIFLKRDVQKVPPNAVSYSPVTTHFADGLVWYERRVNLEFPRFVRARDFWRQNSVTLVIKTKSVVADPQFRNQEYKFTFHAPRIK
jgi:hypothetical protein